MRIPALTGIRGVAAVAVMLYHVPQQAIFAAFRIPLVDRAYLCVDLFFVLSGFVIAIGYQRKVAERLSTASYLDFLRNRMARVFPLHFVVTLAFAARAAANVSGDGGPAFTPIDLPANILMVQAWGLGTHALAGNSWSVSTEVLAYILFPLIALWAISRFAPLLAVVGAALLILVGTSGLGVEGPMDVVQRTSFLPVLRCLGGFALGVLAHRIADHPTARRLLAGDLAFVLVCAAIALAFLVPGGDLLVVFLCPLIVLCCYYDGKAVRAVMANPVSLRLGIISYSIYLWHPLFRDIFARVLHVLHGRGITGADWIVYVAMLAVTWIACEISYRLFEAGGHRLVKRWLTPDRGMTVGAR